MKSTGMARKIDDLGRIVLPAEIRRRFELTEGSLVEISVEGNHIVLGKVEEACVFCGSPEELRTFHDRKVCEECIAQLGGVPSQV